MEEKDIYTINIDAYHKLAGAYQDKFMDMDYYNSSYDVFSDLIAKPDASILELGCGPGNITRYLLNKNPKWKWLATDAAPAMIELAKRNNPAATTRLMDARDMHLITETFDGIVAGFCLPYLNLDDNKKCIRDAHTLLNKDGVIYISFLKGDYAQSGFETNSKGDTTIYMHYYQPDIFRDIFAAEGFELIEEINIPYPGTAQIHVVMMARKITPPA